LQAYPQILGAACKATEVLKKTSIAGLVDVSDLAGLVTSMAVMLMVAASFSCSIKTPQSVATV